MESPSRRNAEAATMPPKLPSTLRPIATTYRRTKGFYRTHLWCCDKSLPRPHAIVRVLHLDADCVPFAVLGSRRRVAQVVLPAQFVCDPARRGVEISRAPDDLGASAAVVRDLAQRERVHAVVHPSSAPRIRRRRPRRRGGRRIAAATAGHRERKRDRETRCARPLKPM